MTMFTDFDAVVAELTAMGVPVAKARAAARSRFGMPNVVNVERDATIDEKVEQREITRLFRAFGFKVYSTSQHRPAKVSPGIPDLWLTKREAGVALFWESKRQVGGERTTAQVEFGDECIAAGVGYGFGDRHDVAEWLVAHGLAFVVNGVLEPTRSEVAA